MLLTVDQKVWCDTHKDELKSLLRELGQIPAPSHHEDKRISFLQKQLPAMGLPAPTVDKAGNVIIPFGDISGNLSVVMAHTDIVFPDTELLPMHEEDGRLYAPGVGDDTANLVNLLVAARYLAEQQLPKQGGLLVVANSCEEGLGNLKGSKQIVADYGSRMKSLITLDGYTGQVVSKVVGSHRYRIRIKAQGGHSYSDFGNTNAIVHMSELVCALSAVTLPTKAKTTWNTGTITGGTTVNSICAECELLYEYRSEDRECLAFMEAFLRETIRHFEDKGFEIDIERIGDRPCSGDVDPKAEKELAAAIAESVFDVTGEPPTLDVAMSTDCNSALSVGIPAVCVGAVRGDGAHTRQEYIELDSMSEGLKIALCVLLHCC